MEPRPPGATAGNQARPDAENQPAAAASGHPHHSRERSSLDNLGQEYAAGYLTVAPQQRLDEMWLTSQMNAANDGDGAPEPPDRLADPTRAWLLLKDAS